MQHYKKANYKLEGGVIYLLPDQSESYSHSGGSSLVARYTKSAESFLHSHK